MIMKKYILTFYIYSRNINLRASGRNSPTIVWFWNCENDQA